VAGRRAEVTIPSDEFLIDGEERNPGVTWPLAVDRWLEQRLAQARAAGLSTSRKELVAALMTAAAPDDDELAQLLRDYRRKKVRDLLDLPEGTAEVVYLKQRPGPRGRATR
jgi:hypothetical protein